MPPNRTDVHRGDIFWTDLSPTQGHEQDGSRPVLIISSDIIHIRMGLVIVIPLTSRVQKATLTHRILIEDKDKVHEPGTKGCPGDSIALVEQMRVLDLTRLEDKRIARISATVLGAVEAGVKYVLDLP